MMARIVVHGGSGFWRRDIRRGLLGVSAAAIRAVETASKRLRGEAGIIAIDRVGHAAAVHNTPLMPWAFSDARMNKPKARKNGKIVSPHAKRSVARDRQMSIFRIVSD